MMHVIKSLFAGSATTSAAGAALYWGWKAHRRGRRLAAEHDRIRAALAVPPSRETFDPAMVADLPVPARRWLRHAIAPGTPLARAAVLTQEGSVRMAPGRPRMRVRADELLVPERGFAWKARVEAGYVRGEVLDHYVAEAGAMHVTLFGLVPVADEEGRDVTRSSLGRLAGESIWVPSTLLPRSGVRWTAIDDATAAVALTIDGETFDLTLEVAPDGRLRRFAMKRHGNAGTRDWQTIPYGFTVDGEATFGGYTIAARLRGGWWYGTPRFDARDASKFAIRSAAWG